NAQRTRDPSSTKPHHALASVVSLPRTRLFDNDHGCSRLTRQAHAGLRAYSAEHHSGGDEHARVLPCPSLGSGELRIRGATMTTSSETLLRLAGLERLAVPDIVGRAPDHHVAGVERPEDLDQL